MPKKLPDNFVNERYRKDQKFIFVYDTYTPNYNSTSFLVKWFFKTSNNISFSEPNITAKFYSKYEGTVEEVDPVLLNNLKRAQDFGPKLKLNWPETTNQK